MSDLVSYVSSLNAAFDNRSAYEMQKEAIDNKENHSMRKTLANLRKDMTHEKVAQVMLECNVDANFINRSERASARFNVYSAEKVANLARFIAKADFVLNHYTLAIVKTLKALESAEFSMTHDDAQSACSSDIRAQDTKKRKLIVQYAKVVAKNTASTQSSSSINALQMFSVINEVRDASNNVAYTLNHANANTEKLLALISA
jgi:sorbitol-specific phosphotransferase system component IIBC